MELEQTTVEEPAPTVVVPPATEDVPPATEHDTPPASSAPDAAHHHGAARGVHMAAHGAAVVASGVTHGVYHLIRQVPYLAVVSVLLAWVGTILTVDSLGDIDEMLEKADISLDLVSRVLSAMLAFTHIVLLAAALISLFSRGLLREWCCGGARNCCLRALECMTLETIPRIVSICCFVVIILQIVMVIVYTALLVVLIVVALACQVGNDFLQNVLKLLDRVPFFIQRGGQERDFSTLEQVCALADARAGDAAFLVAGAAILVFATAMMIMSMGASLAFNSMERKMHRQRKDDEVGRV